MTMTDIDKKKSKVDIILKKKVRVLHKFLFPFVFMKESTAIFDEIKSDFVSYMYAFNKVSPFDGDGWCDEIKFFEKNVRYFLDRGIEMAKILKKIKEEEGDDNDWRHECASIFTIEIEGVDTEEFLEGYTKYVDGVTSIFFLSHLLTYEKPFSDEDVFIRKLVHYTAAISNVLAHSSIKVGEKDIKKAYGC